MTDTATIAPAVVSATTPVSSTSGSSSTSNTVPSIADNFQQFLTLLTTQLQNQDPLSPLDTNQFTQQLVEFAQVEQQLKSNDQLSTLVSLQQTAQATQALNFVGATVAVEGSTAALTNSSASWTLNSPKPASATITITASTGQTAFSGTQTLNTGNQTFTWNGQGNDGTQWPDGNYTMSVAAVDASGQTTAVTTELQGVVDSVDMTKTPPALSIGGQNFTVNQIKQVIR